ncbi:hypothetical protein QWZ14_24895 [Paeniroseomonas aquatica]|uniref:Uncharacterized protein n=1 Tax=Paeniroseomonas aquatica TaxID=373043 RepID=A0ABT8AD12_9PROT|nr:hypothetical protein [Paeniroseomonas aquatica]MDN3567630.1 hypothetical protein [Paeniroseomonas aquatica]
MRRMMLAAVLMLAGPAWGQAPPALREAVVANETDRSLQELFIFRPGAGQEGPDRLGPNVLPPRASLRVALGRTRDCAFEVRATFEGGDEMRRRVDLCRNPRVAFADTGPRREVEVVNQADQGLRELYLATPGARPAGRAPEAGWGPDRLGSETVSAGDSLRLRLRNLSGCVFDLRAVFADGTEEVRERQDVCRVPRLAFGDSGLPLREVTVTNQGRRTLRELYARAADGAADRNAWGSDRLGSSMVEPRSEFRLRLRGAGCAWDLRAVFDDDREEVRRGLDACAAPAVSFGRPVAGEGGSRQVTLVNGFSHPVERAFVSPAESDDWGPDVLGDAVLAPGARQVVRVEGGCQADLRIVFDNRSAEERRGVDICAASTIALRPGWTLEERPGPAAEAGGPEKAALQPGSVRLRNAAALPVVELYADPAGAAQRGPDRLGRTVLGAGESLDFTPPDDLPPGPGRCQADLTAVFRDGREWRLPAADLCTGQELVLQ